MVKIIIKSWRTGLEKVTLSKLQMSVLDVSLSNAKRNVDRLLDDDEVIVFAQNHKIAQYFIAEAHKIGAICELDEKVDL